jgi:hypothetical protein
MGAKSSPILGKGGRDLLSTRGVVRFMVVLAVSLQALEKRQPATAYHLALALLTGKSLVCLFASTTTGTEYGVTYFGRTGAARA